MGVSIYVMPLTRYLTGAFETTWDRKVELAGGEQGFLITPEGVKAGPPERRRLDLESARRYLERVQAEVVLPSGDESRPAVSAVSMSYSSLGDVIEAAGRHGVDRDLGLVRALGDVFLWLPAEFEGLKELPDPFDDEVVVSTASAFLLGRQLGALEDCLDRDPRMEELRELSEGSIVTGLLAEFASRVLTVRTLRQLARQAEERRLPIVVEG